MLHQTMAQSSPQAGDHGPGRKKPLTTVGRAVCTLNVKKKPLSRINGERKKGKL